MGVDMSEQLKNHNKFLNTKEAADFLDLKQNTLEVWRTLGKGPKFLKIGRAVRYRVQDLEEYIDKNIWSSTSEYSNEAARG